MAASIHLKLTNRSTKSPIKKLPASIELPDKATVEDAKIAIAHAAGISDFNRVGLFNRATSTTLKDRKALILDLQDTLGGEILVKDLGPQVSWRSVYMIEYFGPILFHGLVPFLRPYIYRISPFNYRDEEQTPMMGVQWLLFGLFEFHFLKRELETVFIHKFSANTMPASHIVRNSAFYWLMAGLMSALEIYAPGAQNSRPLSSLDYLGLFIFVVGEVCNFMVHRHLASLRKRGGTEKGIPSCIGSSLVTCPNYMFEVLAWSGIILISRSPSVVAFLCTGISYMRSWGRGKEKVLREQFGDKYKKKRHVMIPGLA